MTNRLQYIISQIDINLKTFYFKDIKFVGLCEQIEKNEKTVPTFYRGYGDADFIGFDDTNGMNVYHRLVGMEQDEDFDRGFGSKSLTNENYSMVMVAYGNQRQVNDSTNNINYKVADDLRTLFIKKLSKLQLSTLEALSGLVNVTGTEHNRQTVFNQELPDSDMKVAPETLLFAIQYTISLQYIGECKTVSCE